MKPVFRNSVPMWGERGGIMVPLWADNPCNPDCCEDEGGGPNKPYPSCSACLVDVTGVRASLSGFENRTCVQPFNPFAPNPANTTNECLGAAYNRSFVLNTLIAGSASSKTFELVLGTGEPCGGGILVMRRTRQPIDAGVPQCVTTAHLWRLQCTVRCVLGGIRVDGLVGQRNGCIPPGLICSGPLDVGCDGGPVIDSVVDGCDIGLDESIESMANHCHLPGQTVCQFDPFTITHTYRLLF